LFRRERAILLNLQAARPPDSRTEKWIDHPNRTNRTIRPADIFAATAAGLPHSGEEYGLSAVGLLETVLRPNLPAFKQFQWDVFPERLGRVSFKR